MNRREFIALLVGAAAWPLSRGCDACDGTPLDMIPMHDPLSAPAELTRPFRV